MKLIVDLFNELQTLVLKLSQLIMKGYIFIIDVTSTGVDEKGIEDVWIMLRDICNMFFILILLIIGISTILGIKKYSYRKNLINVLISAFLINYSKVIIGMMIDFSQIFIIPFNDAISNSISLITDSAFIIDAGQKSLSAAILGLLFGLAFFAVSIIALVYSLIRLVFIWITIAISPIIVLGYGIPFTKVKESLKGFFQKFVSFLTGGVLLSFFMWFSLYVLSVGSSNMVNKINNDTYFATNTPFLEEKSTEEEVDIKGANIILMIVSLAFLVYAQKFAISSSKQAGSFAGEIASKAGAIGMKPLNGLKGLGLKSANLGKNALGGAANIGKDYASSAFNNIKGVGLSSLRNKSNFFDKTMTNREKRLDMGNKAWREEITNRLMFGGVGPLGFLKNKTLNSLKEEKSTTLAGLKSSGASVTKIKLANFNWDLKIKEKEMEIARENLKKAPSGDARDKAQKELNTKRAEYAKSKSNKNKYINELKNIQLGKSASSEDSSQLKGVKEIMDNLGDGKNVNLKKDHKNSLDETGKFKRLSTYERDQVMAEIIAKIKSKNLEKKDIEFINTNQAMFRSVSQDVLATMNSEIDKNYKDNKEVQGLKQKIKDPGTFELDDKLNADIEKGKEYQEYKDLINKTFSEVKNIKTEEEKDEKLGELNEKDVKEDFKELFKKHADLAIKKIKLDQIKNQISEIYSIDNKEEFSNARQSLKKLKEDLKTEKVEYEELKKQVSSKKIKDLEVGVIKKKEANEEDFSEEYTENFSKGFENNYEGFGESNSSSQGQGTSEESGSDDKSEGQETSEESGFDNWDNISGFGEGGLGNVGASSQPQGQGGFGDSDSTEQSEDASSDYKSESQETSEESDSDNKNKINRASSKSQNRRVSVDKPNSRKAGNLRYAQKKKKAKESGQFKGQKNSGDLGSGKRSGIQEEHNRVSYGFGAPINNNDVNFNKYPGNKENINQFSNTQNPGTTSFSDNIKSKIKDVQDNIIKENEKELNKNKEPKIKNKENSGKNNKKGGPNINNNENDKKLGNKRPNNARRGNRNK